MTDMDPWALYMIGMCTIAVTTFLAQVKEIFGHHKFKIDVLLVLLCGIRYDAYSTVQNLSLQWRVSQLQCQHCQDLESYLWYFHMQEIQVKVQLQMIDDTQQMSVKIKL